MQEVAGCVTSEKYPVAAITLGCISLAQMGKDLPARQETQVPSLGREDSPGEGNSNPLQYSCLENSMDRGGW